MLAGRPARRWYALGLAAAVTLLLNPRSAADPGWQLSFAAVAALLAGAPAARKALARRLPGPVADAAAVTAVATVGTAPLMALYFDQLSLASLPANLLAAPAIAPITWLGVLAAAAAQLAPALAAPFTALAAPLLVYVRWVAHATAALPLAAVPGWTLAPLTALAATAALAVRRAAVERARRAAAGRPWPVHPAGLAAAVAALAIVGGVVTARAAAGRRAPAPGELVVSFLDVGQGDATLLQRDGTAVLVDTGPPDGPILARLREAHVRQLAALLLTHAQADHEGAAPAVLHAVPTRLVIDGGAGWASRVQRALPRAVAADGAREIVPRAGEVVSLGGIRLRILWPPPPDGPLTGDPNARAGVARAEVGAFSLLLTADAESDVTGPLDLAPVTALKVAHHGSADPGLPALLARLRPRIAAIEVGRHNSYGHPAPSTVAELRAAVPTVVRTDRDGTVRLHVLAGRMWLER
jgi:competence protein ComEC